MVTTFPRAADDYNINCGVLRLLSALPPFVQYQIFVEGKVLEISTESQRTSMARPKRNLLSTAQETSSPPAVLDDNHAIARVRKAEGKNLYLVELPSDGKPLLVELPSRFRSQIWIKRGGYVVVDTAAFLDRDNKLDGEIVNVVRDEKAWRKQSYWYAVHP